MRTSTVFAILASALTITSVTADIEVSAWSGIVCSGIELGVVRVPQNFQGLSPAEETPNGSCLHIDTDLPANCDVYLCADANCNDQGITVDGPRAAGTRIQDTDFEAMQIGCQ